MREVIRKIILVSILLVSIGVFVVRNRAFVAKHNVLSQYKCDIPVTYAIGNVDSRFGVSPEKFSALVQEAEKRWETALGRDVFQMKADGRVKINLTYDERQMTTEYLKKIGADIKSDKQKIDESMDDYKSLAAQLEQKKSSFNADSKKYEQAKNDYTDDANQYQKDLNNYNQNVSAWNANGGASGGDYSRITQQKKDLDQQYDDLKNQESDLKKMFDSLEKKRQEVNVLVAKVNSLASATNKIAGKTNEEVANYNQTQAQRGEFETGLYVNNQGVESIDIFQFADDQDLLAVLIHEMGHSLGLAHAQNQSDIMYPKLINQTADITPDDAALFQSTCVR